MKQLKQLFLLLVCSAGLFSHVAAQVNVQWQPASGSVLTISGSTIYGTGRANSAQKLQVCENGAIEFTTQKPNFNTLAGNYTIGFARASNPSVVMYGLFMYFDPAGGNLYGFTGGTGSNMPATNCAIGPLPFANCDITGSNCQYFNTGDKFKIERVNNVINFWHISSTIPAADPQYPAPNCNLIFSAGAINSTPTDEWVVYFYGGTTTASSSAITSCTVNFSNQCGESNLWSRINTTSIRPLKLTDKVGIGKDPVSTLDVQGTARFSSIANANPLLVTTDVNGQLSLSTLKTADIATTTALSTAVTTAIAGLPKSWQLISGNVITGHGAGGYPSGNVGIAISNPLERLHLDGTIRATSLAGTMVSATSLGNKQLVADVNGNIIASPLDWQRMPNSDLVTGYNNTSGYAANNVGIGTSSPTWNFKLTVDNRDNTAAPNNGRNAIHAIAMHGNCTHGYGIQVNTNVLGGTKAIAVMGDGTERALIFGNGMSWFRNRMIIGGATGPTLGNCDENDPMETHVLTIFGSALASGGMWVNSDARFKTNINPIAGADELLNKLNPVSYQYKTKEFEDRNFSEGMTYGFIAQELKEVLPYTVKEERDGYYSVNYTAVIPVLVAAMKQQQKQIEELKLQLQDRQPASFTGTGNTTDSKAIKDGYLDQNVPNPFTGNTEIKYKLPTGGRKGVMGIYDLNGRELKLFQLNSAEGVLSLTGMDLQPGIYIYMLIVDGQPYDSKKMILTSH